MMDLLKHLIPDFAHMFSANPNGISAWFWSATALIFGLSLYCKRTGITPCRRIPSCAAAARPGRWP
ncbi:hypothetical protein R0C92_32875, partial [Pseudomonas aeruginosa]|uniref:hypothetical protein n=1 Tax=Pseudomonas aeruginosa TaxID=287 RepID=UPI002935A9A0